MVDSDATGKKGCFVGEIKNNDSVKGLFLVKEMVSAETKAGKPFLTLVLMDKTGDITARVWDNALQLAKECAPGTIVFLDAQAQSYKENIQLKVLAVRAENKDSVDWSMFMPSTPYDTKEMFAELKKIASTVDDPNIQALLLSFLSDPTFVKMFKNAPAAKNMHHAYLGGLLEHTLGVVRLANMVAEVYENIDRSLLICGAFLHDIGKVTEFSYEIPPFNYSDQGRLLGHMVLAVEMIQERLSRCPEFPEDLATRIKHLVVSHHGKYEFGSPSLPMLRESFVLNFIDDLDAKMNYMDKLNDQADQSGYHWTQYQRPLERFLFVPGHTTVEEPLAKLVQGEAESENESVRQPTLWG